MNLFSLLAIIGLVGIPSVLASFRMADNCRVFCQGPLLEAVQNAHLFHDSKDFVDMPLKYSPDETLLAFDRLENKTDHAVIKQFVDDYFMPPGTELQSCHPGDWTAKPKSFEKIEDPVYRQWAYDIHGKWPSLCRRVKDDVKKHPNLYSLITVPYPFIAPGGRFREFYYWDTYWIVKGLLASEMITTAKNMIRNLGDMVRRFGFVPNGGRVYYLRRTQPPLFSGMVMEYFNATKDVEFVQEMLPLLDKEYKYWMTERTVDWTTPKGDTFQMFQYKVNQDTPRPESFKEDLLSTSHLEKNEDKVRVWSDIAAACESGWDFSSRWFDKSGPYKDNIRGVRTSKVIPVDLNSFMCWNSAILSSLHGVVGNNTATAEYGNQHKVMKHAISQTMWNEEDGTWYDLDMDTKEMSKNYYVSNPTPLFTDCVHNPKGVHEKVADYLKKVSASTYPGGLPTSLTWSGEQWDSPNGWAPTNHIVIEGLRKSDSLKAQETALELADKWIQTNYFAFARSGGKMFEKYNVETFKSAAGSGGEYEVQEGFGWTNGVILDLLLTYGDRLRAPPVPPLVLTS